MRKQPENAEKTQKPPSSEKGSFSLNFRNRERTVYSHKADYFPEGQ